MTRTKFVLGLTAMLTVFALTAATASAKFVGGGGATTGSSQLQTNTGAVLENNPSAAPIVSSKAPDTWRIQDSKKEQNVTKEGQHLDIEIQFEEPFAITPGGKIPVTINHPTTIQIVQKGTTFTALISKSTTVNITTSASTKCTINLLAENNTELKEVVPTTVGSNIELKANITNLKTTVEPTATCNSLGVFASNSGKFKSTSIEHNVTVV